MSFAVDTNALSYVLKGDERLAGILRDAEAVAVPIVVVAELWGGFLHGKKEKLGRILDSFVSEPNVATLQITDETVSIYAEIYAYARSRGKQLSINDNWIAALCIQYNYPLLTFDKDFDALPQVRRVRVE